MTAPLEHLKILDFSTLMPGPYATMMLADLGADVVRIEAPNRPDLTRLTPPVGKDGQSALHAFLNRSKRSLGLNLKAPSAAEIIHRLVVTGGYDIIVEQFRPGVMDRLGVGFEELKKVCPQVIYGSLTGFGQTGPLKDRAGHDINYLALSGLLSQYGRANTAVPPPPLPVQVADIGAGSLHLVIGLLAAVVRRAQTGEGARVDISMADGALAWNVLGASKFLAGGENPLPEAELLNGGSYYDIYETKDGRFLAVGALEPKFWRGFCEAIGREDLITLGVDPGTTRRQAGKAEIRKVIQRKSWAEWRDIFARKDVCVEPVLTTEEALNHPQTVARGMVVDLPTHDGSRQKQIGSPIKLSAHAPAYQFSGAPLGQHSRDILSEIGYTKNEIDLFYQHETVAGESS